MTTGLINSWTEGEIGDDAWDRIDIQPITKGCEEATNLVIRIAGPLGKRRGFWDLGAVEDERRVGRLIPFRRSIDDALMLEFGQNVVRVWQANGAPLLDMGVQVSFASPYTTAQLDGLRYKQVADVIYFRHRTGLAPRTLQRDSNTAWAFNVESFPNGPFLGENNDAAKTVTIAGTSEADANTITGAGTFLVGAVVGLTATSPIFNVGQVGGTFRLRQNTGAPGVKTWSTGFRPAIGDYTASNGRVYVCTTVGTRGLVSGVDTYVTTPPVQDAGDQSDGSNIWTYRHDGAGVVQITAVIDAMTASGVVVRAVPLQSGDATPCYAEGAYSDYRGWPRMWPGLIEERLVDGATASNLDMLDLTASAGFDPLSQTFTPGLGDGEVIDTDAMRRRVSDDGAEILWSMNATFLLVGTASGEHIVSGGLFGEPVTPATVVVRELSGFGSDDVKPVKVHKGVFYVTRGGQAVRKLQVDVQQNADADDLSFLATHISKRLFRQLAWVPYPDETLWVRLGDGGVVAMTNHEEQQVRGWTRQSLANGAYQVEDVVTLPGPGRLETLWAIVSRFKNGATQRRIWMQSQASDGLFMDGAQLYAGAPATVFAGLDAYEHETVRALADGVQYDLVVSGGTITLPSPASNVMVGLGFKTRFKSLKIALGALAAGLNLRQRITQLIVRLKTSLAKVGIDGGLLETVSTRTAGAVPGASSQPVIDQATVAAGSSRDPRIVIEEDTAYDHVIYSIRPSDAIGG